MVCVLKVVKKYMRIKKASHSCRVRCQFDYLSVVNFVIWVAGREGEAF